MFLCNAAASAVECGHCGRGASVSQWAGGDAKRTNADRRRLERVMTNWARATQPVYAGRRGRRAPPSIEASEAKARVAARDPAIQLLGACQRGLQRGAKRCAP